METQVSNQSQCFHFMYCEDHTPSRLDLGKQQYGGLFTIEEVEDVKIFLRLLLLLSTLFGYHIAGDDFAVANHCLVTTGF